MRIFLTGATGFIGSHIIPELLAAGHQVLGLTRSEEGAEKLRAAGVEPHHGNVEDLDSLRSGAAATDGTIHCAFNHDFSDFMQNTENDRLAITAMGEALLGSSRPLLVTSGVGMGISEPGKPGSEDFFSPDNPNPRKASEMAGEALRARGVNTVAIRLPQVHDTHKQGLITWAVDLARQKGVSPYIGEGKTRWAACPVADVARLYHLAFEKHAADSSLSLPFRYNAVAEEGVAMRDIAEVIARGLNVPAKSITPEEAPAHFGWMALFAAYDMTGSSTLTRERLNWAPTGPSLLTDLANMKY
jgi:nucleoside-diphosphate-sugar epimerase